MQLNKWGLARVFHRFGEVAPSRRLHQGCRLIMDRGHDARVTTDALRADQFFRLASDQNLFVDCSGVLFSRPERPGQHVNIRPRAVGVSDLATRDRAHEGYGPPRRLGLRVEARSQRVPYDLANEPRDRETVAGERGRSNRRIDRPHPQPRRRHLPRLAHFGGGSPPLLPAESRHRAHLDGSPGALACRSPR